MAKKNVPQIRFNGFEGEWEEKRLGEIVSMHARIGWQNLRKNEFLDNGDYYLITGTDFVNNKVNLEGCHYVSEDRYNQDKNIQVDESSILITKDGTLGKVAMVDYLDRPATLNAGVFNVKLYDKNTDNKYLFQYLKAHFLLDYVKERSTGGTIKHLNQCILVDFPVCKSNSLAEQNKIASLFTSLDKQISCSEAKLEKLRTVKKTLLKKMFASTGEKTPEIRFKGFDGKWEVKILGEIGEVSMCRRIFKWQTLSIGDIPFYKIGTFGQEADSFIDFDLFKEYKNKYPYPQKGDILISAAGTIGRTVVYNGEDAYFQDSNIVWLKHNGEKISNDFLKHFYNIIEWFGIEGSTIKRLYNNNILNTKCGIPSLSEQTRIASLFTSLDKQISLQEQKIEKLRAVKKTLLKKMFV